MKKKACKGYEPGASRYAFFKPRKNLQYVRYQPAQACRKQRPGLLKEFQNPDAQATDLVDHDQIVTQIA